ncbi:hypothetical protein M7I_4774 [Glarea lozoyensis 74030]|uniref:Uncharacterized protein n=1 Tax=Glarea lozoyensis (strain ATCC 74030 / MF5533) TaxID=1104152 RepID=H0EQ31_GLAL7|nr:hypothetical protein M7I_4774 [Glarea lozoyensis 74030]
MDSAQKETPQEAPSTEVQQNDAPPDPLTAITDSLPPATDYLTYLTILESHLSPDILPKLNDILQDEELTQHIGWDLIHLLLPLPGGEKCLETVARLGNPREVVLKVTEALQILELDNAARDEEGEEQDEEDTEETTADDETSNDPNEVVPSSEPTEVDNVREKAATSSREILKYEYFGQIQWNRIQIFCTRPRSRGGRPKRSGHTEETITVIYTLEHCPYETLKASAVSWLKEELVTAQERKTENVFGTTLALAAAQPYLFPDTSALREADEKELEEELAQSFPFHMAVLNFIYLISNKQFSNVVPPGMMVVVEEIYLGPLRAAQTRALAAQQDGEEGHIDHAHGFTFDLQLLGDRLALCSTHLET